MKRNLKYEIMNKRLLNSNFTDCECVYSRKLGKLIPVFELVPKKEDNEDWIIDGVDLSIAPGTENMYIDHFEYPKTGEEFDICTEVINGAYDLIKKEVMPVKEIITCESWITEDLVGEKVIDQHSGKSRDERGKTYVSFLTIDKVLLTLDELDRKISRDNVNFVKRKIFKNILKIIVKE